MIFLLAMLNSQQHAMADDDALPAATEAKASSAVIHLPESNQAQAGIQTEILSATRHQSELLVNGKAVNIQPLLALRSRYLLSLTESQSALALTRHSEQNLQRLEDLYQHGATAKRSVQAQQAQLQTEQSQVQARQIQGQAIIDEARLSWGHTLTEWAMSSGGSGLQQFLSGQHTLLLIALPMGTPTPLQLQQLSVDNTGNRNKAQTAALISAAPQPEGSVAGEYYFFHTDGARIKPGMRISAWLPDQQQQTGVVIPKSALIWHMNQAYVYLKTAADTFSKHAITGFTPTANGYFVSSGLTAGQRIVTTGAQLLLSNEVRAQIPDDD